MDQLPLARLRYSNLRFHVYDLLAPSNRVEDLLSELDRDPTCIFWADPASQGPQMQLSCGQPAPSRWGQVGLTSPAPPNAEVTRDGPVLV